MKQPEVIVWTVVAIWVLLAAALIAYSSAHDEVARECDLLGGFYFGKQVYECKRKKDQDAQQEIAE